MNTLAEVLEHLRDTGWDCEITLSDHGFARLARARQGFTVKAKSPDDTTEFKQHYKTAAAMTAGLRHLAESVESAPKSK